jgi:ATP-dependent RNA helicase DeaD
VEERSRVTTSEPPAENKPAESVALEPGMVKLYLNLGKRDRLRPPEIQELIASRSGVESLQLQIRNTHTYILVHEEKASAVAAALHGQEVGGRVLICERAKKG